MLRNVVSLGAFISAVCINGSYAFSHTDTSSPADEIAPPRPTFKGDKVVVKERLGAKLPLDAMFRTAEGKLVTLGDVLAPSGNTMPTILTFNYSDCPMLCNLQLNGVQTALGTLGETIRGMQFRLGSQFRIVTVDLEPSDSPDRATKMREKYLAKVPEAQRSKARAGWSFLVAAMPGDGSQIRRVADAAGFSYTYLPERAEWAHPAALIFLSTSGMVTRYVYGIEFDDAVMRESLIKAGISESSTAVGFMNRCYHYDPDAGGHARAGVLALRFGAAGFMVVILCVLAILHIQRRQNRRDPESTNPIQTTESNCAQPSASSFANPPGYGHVEMKS